MRLHSLLFIFFALISNTLSAGKLEVVTTLFPLYDFAKEVGADKVDVSLLLPPGVEPHSFSPTPKDIVRIGNSDIFIYTGENMEPWVGDVLRGIDKKDLKVLDASSGIELAGNGKCAHSTCGHSHHSKDPHIWLDPILAKKIVSNIAGAFAEKDPANRDFYLANAKKYNAKLDTLDREIRDVLSKCELRTVIYGGHSAFGYFAKRYKLTFVSPYAGFSPNARPTPKSIVKLIKKTRKLGVNTIYHEELVKPKVGQIITEETGAKLSLLHGAHNISKKELKNGVSYLKIMKDNLESLKTGLKYKQ